MRSFAADLVDWCGDAVSLWTEPLSLCPPHALEHAVTDVVRREFVVPIVGEIGIPPLAYCTELKHSMLLGKDVQVKFIEHYFHFILTAIVLLGESNIVIKSELLKSRWKTIHINILL